jgi:hypothetical protein
MKDVRCNIALGTWYYYVYATGNGGRTIEDGTGSPYSGACYLYQYCTGACPTADTPRSNLVIGMNSHLDGPEGFTYDPADPYASRGGYVDEIKGWFDTMVGTPPEPHPFLRELEPNPSQYCR